MPLSEQEWRRVTQPNEADRLALNVVEASIPAGWPSMSPYGLMTGAATIAMHYDRKRMAEALRDRILHRTTQVEQARIKASLPPEMQEAFDFLVGMFEMTLFEVANQVEEGKIGHAH